MFAVGAVHLPLKPVRSTLEGAFDVEEVRLTPKRYRLTLNGFIISN